MPYYHVYIEQTDKRGKKTTGFTVDLSESRIRKAIVNPYLKNKQFILHGKLVRQSSIDRIDIYKSDKKFEELVLPNGESIMDAKNEYIRRCFSRGEVKGVELRTNYFIDFSMEEEPTKTPAKPLGKKKKVFIVHGRDVEQALRLQKYLTRRLKLDAIVFDDLPDKGKTIMEQLEYIQDNVGYAIAIVTPDDVGCLVDDMAQIEIFLTRGRKSLKVKELDEIFDLLTTRPRQNVIFELGLFIGALGRDKVCYLLQKEVQDELSDLHGILHKSFDKSVEEIFHEIADELK